MLHFHLYAYETDFDFLAGKLPVELVHYFGDQLRRAQILLGRRTNAQIGYALDSLDWMLRKCGDLHHEELMKSEEDEQFISRAKALQTYQRNIDIREQEDFPEASWAEYFAVLALANVLEELSRFNNPVSHLPRAIKMEEPSPYQINVLSAIEAQDAVTYAEGLIYASKSASDVAKEMGRKGGSSRINAKDYNALRRRVLLIWEAKYKSRTNRNAAFRIYEHELTDTDRSILKGDEPEKRLEIWIGQYKNGVISLNA